MYDRIKEGWKGNDSVAGLIEFEVGAIKSIKGKSWVQVYYR